MTRCRPFVPTLREPVSEAGALASDDERARELARMMSGGVTPKAVARAHELLAESRSTTTK